VVSPAFWVSLHAANKTTTTESATSKINSFPPM
jgi:hypothetical protein